MPISAPCSREFYPAAHSSGKRTLSKIKWIVLARHRSRARPARRRRYFKSKGSGGSAHLCVDDNECYRCLANEDDLLGSSGSQRAGLPHRAGGLRQMVCGHLAQAPKDDQASGLQERSPLPAVQDPRPLPQGCGSEGGEGRDHHAPGSVKGVRRRPTAIRGRSIRSRSSCGGAVVTSKNWSVRRRR